MADRAHQRETPSTNIVNDPLVIGFILRNAVTSQPTIENTTVTPVSTPEFKGEWVIHGNPTSNC